MASRGVFLDLTADPVDLTRQLVDIESVSGNEGPLADRIEAALRPYGHLEVIRDGNVIIARTNLGRAERVVIAGHIDTVPVAGNLPSWTTGSGDALIIWGRGTCDMKGGVAVQLSLAVALTEPVRDVTWICYDNEEVEADLNGLGRIGREHPDYLAGSFGILCEPSNARIEGGCQGTLRAEIRLTGQAAHSARSWRGHNAIHDAAEVLRRLASYQPREPVVDGLTYHEGLNAVGITGGIAGNVIPDSCTVTVNYRFAPDLDSSQAAAHVRQVFTGFDLVITDLAPGARPGLELPAAAEFCSVVGGTPQAKLGWTDVARFSELGVPAVNFGPGDPSKAHADDECCPAADVVACHAALLRWLSEPAGAGSG